MRNQTTHVHDFDATASQVVGAVVTWIALPVGIIGLITNSLNIAVHVVIGFQDSISFCFCALSTSDLCFISVMISSNIFQGIGLIKPILLYNMNIWIDVINFYGDMVFDISAFVKTFIAVQRGCCVAFPFHIHRIFKTRCTLVVTVCLCLLIIIPYLNGEFLKVTRIYASQIPDTNQTYYITMFENVRGVSTRIRHYFNKTVIICVCEILILLSMIAIVCCMPINSKWRHWLSERHEKDVIPSKTGIRSSNCLPKKGRNGMLHNFNHTGNKITFTNKQTRKIETRELRVVNQVALVSAIHLICYTPVAVFAIVYQLVVDGHLPWNQYTYYLCSSLHEFIRFTCQINASVNFFVYYKYNYMFKRTVNTIFRRLHADC